MVDPLLCLVRVWTSTYGTPAGMEGGIVGQSTKPEAVEAQAGKAAGATVASAVPQIPLGYRAVLNPPASSL